MRITDQLTCDVLMKEIALLSSASHRHLHADEVDYAHVTIVRPLENIFYFGLNGLMYEECYTKVCSPKKE